MDYTDEQILKAKSGMKDVKSQQEKDQLIEKELEKSIYDEDFTMFGIPVKFEKFYLLDDKVSMYMPEGSEPMSDEEIGMSYFLGNKPQYVYTSDQQEFNVCFNYTEHKVPNEHVWDFLKAFQIIIERVGPSTRITGQDKWEDKGVKYSSIEFVSQAIDYPIYNMMFFASLEGKILIGSINFITKHHKRLGKVAQEMIQSFRLEEKGEDE